MSLIYSILKPVLRKASAGRAVMTREDFAKLAIKKQRRDLTFPEITGYEKRSVRLPAVVAVCIQRRGVTTVKPSFIMQEADI